jgi:hypothetical protein
MAPVYRPGYYWTMRTVVAAPLQIAAVLRLPSAGRRLRRPQIIRLQAARRGLAQACRLVYAARTVQHAVVIVLTLVLAVALLAPPISARERPFGAWTVWERTDVKTCAAWHTSTPDVWMTRDGLSIAPHGGISVFRYRVGDEPMRVRLATPHERAAGTVEVAGQTLAEAIEAGRLEIEVLTTLHTLYEANVDLSNANEVLRAVRACS